MTEVHVVRVFTDEQGRFGNPLGIVLDTAAMSEEERQQIATRLNYSETVFVDDIARARLHIHTPALEIPLAGHPLVGSAWFLSQHAGTEVKKLRPVLAGEVETWQEGGLTWVRANIDEAPDWRFVRIPKPEDIDVLQVPPGPEYDLHEFWAWEDEAAGVVRARVFASRYGVAEDEATGSGALRFMALLAQPLTIHQGQGSVLYARPAGLGRGEVGGRVVSDGVREA